MSAGSPAEPHETLAPGIAVGAIDWKQPWLLHWAATGQPVAQALAGSVSLASALGQVPAVEAGSAMRFVPADDLPEGRAYESHVFLSSRIPTRDNLHDFFNGLAWHRFPRTKRHLNRLQAGEIARAAAPTGVAGGTAGTRGPVRDAITVFDENGALLLAPDLLWQALAARDWRALFITHRALWADAQCVLFGHALLEKLLAPRKAITAHVLRAPHALVDSDALDGWLASALTPALLAGKPFAPLPVLGVPGWWPANEDPAFYADPQVFRGLRVPTV